MPPVAPSSDVLNAFGAESFYGFVADLGATRPTNETADPVGSLGYTFIGGADIDQGFTLTLPGTPDKTVVKEFRDGGTPFYTTRQTTDDLPTFAFTALETSRVVLETLLGIDFDANGVGGYVNKVMPAKAWIFDLYNAESEVIRLWFENGTPSLSGDISVAGTDRLMRWGGQVEGDKGAVSGHQFELISARFADGS